MHQAPAKIWNQLAETQRLTTPWAQMMFPLPAEEMDAALAKEEERLATEAGSAKVASAYLMVMPLLWERSAIRAMTEATGPVASLPLVESVQEAVIVASKDLPLTRAEQKTLSAMLKTPPTVM